MPTSTAGNRLYTNLISGSSTFAVWLHVFLLDGVRVAGQCGGQMQATLCTNISVKYPLNVGTPELRHQMTAELNKGEAR
jgi:hypothetical protein